MSIDLVKGQFDVNKFNIDFQEATKKLQEEEKIKETQKLQQLNKIEYVKKISDMTFREMLITWKESLLGFLNDLLHLRINKDLFTHEYRLFFLGITLLLSVILFYGIHRLFIKSKINDRNNKIINEYHIFSHLTEAKPE